MNYVVTLFYAACLYSQRFSFLNINNLRARVKATKYDSDPKGITFETGKFAPSHFAQLTNAKVSSGR